MRPGISSRVFRGTRVDLVIYDAFFAVWTRYSIKLQLKLTITEGIGAAEADLDV